MFNKNLNDSLQLLHNCVTEVEIMHSKHQNHHNFNLHLNHILNGLKSVQTSLRQTISQYLQLASKIQNKISRNSDKKEGEQIKDRACIRELNLQELEMLIEQALIRRKMDHASFYTKESELILQQASLSKFPVLLAQIKKHRENMRQIQQINHNLQTLQRNLQVQTRKTQTNLESILKRLEKINLSISQAEDQFKDKKKSIELAEFIKYHNQTQNILKLIQYGNICSLQQFTAEIQNCQLKTSVCRVIQQMKRYDQHTHTIYQFLYQIVVNSFSQVSKKLQMNYHFLKSLERFNLSQKLKECTKLITQYKRNTVSVIPECVRSYLEETNSKTHIKPNNDVIKLRAQQSQRDEHYFQQQMLLLQHQESIHELKLQLKVRNEQKEIMQTYIQKKIEQTTTLKQQNNLLQEQSQHLQKEIQKLRERQIQLMRQSEKSMQNIIQLQENIINLKQQLANVTRQTERQIETNQALVLESQNQKATIQQLKIKIQDTNKNLQAALTELVQCNILNQELKYQNQANKQSICNIQQIIFQYQQKELIRQNIFSLKIVNNVYHLWVEPTHHQIKPSPTHHQRKPSEDELIEEQQMQTKNIDEAHFDESFSQTNSNIEQQHNYKVNIIQTKSFSGQNQNEQMSNSPIKEEEYLHPHQNEQLHKSMCMKDKAIKKYQIYLNRYKHEVKKYQKEILDLQAKTRKLELQILHLNQIIEEHNIQKELLSIEELPHDNNHLNISEDVMEHSHIEKLTQKEAELRVKEESINFKIQGIINAVLQLNAFKTEIKPSSQTSLIDAELYELGLDSFNPQSNS